MGSLAEGALARPSALMYNAFGVRELRRNLAL